MSGPFEVGDVVVCVDAASPSRRPCVLSNEAEGRAFLREGAVYRVSDTPQIEGIQLYGCPLRGRDAYFVGRFRHLPKADEQFTAQMRACSPSKRSVPA